MAERAAPDWSVALKLFLVLCALACLAVAPPAVAADKPGKIKSKSKSKISNEGKYTWLGWF